MSKITRRSVLRGIVRGAVVGVALPYLDCFLGTSGQALAATGQRIPTRFGTWIWGCGFIPEKWIPTATGADYDDAGGSQAARAVSRQARDPERLRRQAGWRPEQAAYHWLPGLAHRCSSAERGGQGADARCADQRRHRRRHPVSIDRDQHFRDGSVLFVPCGRFAQSQRMSPLRLYQRLFVEGFQDPNAAKFKPDPRTMARQSVLSAVQGGSPTVDARGRRRRPSPSG